MTVWAIGLDITLFLIILLISACVYSLAGYYSSVKKFIISFIIGIICLAAIICFQLYYYKNTESGKRAIKTQESNFNGGIDREIKVYDINGEVIEIFKGKFDIEYDNDRILFDDEKGNRHIIYYPTGTIIINEIKEK